MRIAQQLVLVALLNFAFTGWSQNTKIIIPAGTPADKDLVTIAAETDPQKRIALYTDFIQKYADDKAAAAYGELQLSQLYLTSGDAAKATEHCDKALELYPNDLDIVVAQASIAQVMKDNGKVVSAAVHGAAIFNSIGTQPKPADVSEEDWKSRVTDEQESARSDYDFLQTTAYNAIAAEQDPSKRMSYIEEFTPAFPKSKFEQPISQLALYSLQQLNQPERLEAYGEKALAANPDSIPILLMLANAYSEDSKQLTKAAADASKVITLIGANPNQNQKLSAGVAHSTLGYVYLKQGKLTTAVPELKTAVGLLQDDPQAQQAALFRLGYAYAKQNRRAESVAALQKAAALEGPYKAQAKEMLAKVNGSGK